MVTAVKKKEKKEKRNMRNKIRWCDKRNSKKKI